MDLRIRPIHHRTEAVVRVHIFIYLLANYDECDTAVRHPAEHPNLE